MEKHIQVDTIAVCHKAVLTAEEMAWYLGVPIGGLYKLTCKNEIPYYKTGKRIYFKREEMEAWITRNRVKTAEEVAQEAINYCIKHKK